MIRLRKKGLAVFLLAGLLLTGCAAEQEVPETTAAAETAAETMTVAETAETAAATAPLLTPVAYETGIIHGTEVFFCNEIAFPV